MQQQYPKGHEHSDSSYRSAARLHIACHAAFIAFQRGKKRTWDPARPEFPDDEEANRMRTRALREPWRLS